MDLKKSIDGQSSNGKTQERVNSEQRPSLVRQLSASLLGWSTALTIGTNIAYISVGLYSLQEEGRQGRAPFLITDWDIGLFGSTLNFTAIIAALSSGWIAHKFGRKRPGMMAMVPYIASWLVVAFATNFAMFLAGSIIGWLFLFMRAPLSRMHVSEVAHPRHRGQLLSLIFTFLIAGNCVEFVAALVLNWKGLALLNAAIPFALLFVEACLPESHVWLISVGRRDEAKTSLQWVYGDGYDCREDFMESERHYDDTKEATKTFKDIFTFQYLKPVLIMFLLILVRSFTGCTTVMIFVSQIFKKANSGIDPKYAVIILGCGELVFILFSGKMMDVIGRRKCVLLSGLIMGFSQTGFGVYLYFQETPSLAYLAERCNWMPVVLLTLTMIGFCLGMGPVMVVLLGEMLPIQIKNACNGIMNAWLSATSLFAIATFQWMYQVLRPSGTFWFYSCCCFLLIVLFLAVIPETKGQSLCDIEKKLTSTDLTSMDAKA